MKLGMSLLVRDEVDIIRSTLDYHLREGIDHIIVTDNGSCDGTVEILEEYARNGAIELCHEPPSDYSQGVWVTAMARRLFCEYGADWIINCDADEFFVFRNGSLRDTLARAPSGVSRLVASRHNFVALDRPCSAPPPLEMIYRHAVSRNLRGRVLPPKVIHRGAADVVVPQGNHDAQSASFSEARAQSEIEVFHYPVRSLAQYERNTRNAGSGYARNESLPVTAGFHKRYAYDLLLKGELARDYSARHHRTQEQLSAALASGELVEDLALAARLSS